jgi:hypothetical protein
MELVLATRFGKKLPQIFIWKKGQSFSKGGTFSNPSCFAMKKIHRLASSLKNRWVALDF